MNCLINLFPSYSPAKKIKTLDQVLESLKPGLTPYQLRSLIAEWKENFAQVTLEDLDKLLIGLSKWAIESGQVDLLLDEWGNLIDLEKMIEVGKSKNNSFESLEKWAQERSEWYPRRLASPNQEKEHFEWSRYRPLIIYFIPKMVNMFLETINILDRRKRGTTLFDRSIIIDMFIKLCLIPYGIVKVLEPVLIVPVKVYGVAILVIFGMGTLIAYYRKCMKFYPDDISNCENWDQKYIEPKVERANVINPIISSLLAGRCVILVADSGAGKTTALHNLAWRKRNEKLPQELQKLNIYEVDVGALNGNGTFGYAEMVDQTRMGLEGREDSVLLFFDKFEQIASNESCFKYFAHNFIEKEPAPLFVATVTKEGYKKLQECDVDGSFVSRADVIKMASASVEENETILWDYWNRHGKELPITAEAVTKIAQLADKTSNIGSTRIAETVLKEASGQCEWSYNPDFITDELAQEKQKKSAFGIQRSATLEESKTFDQTRMIALEKELEEQKPIIAKIKSLRDTRFQVKDALFSLTHKIAEKKATLKEQKIYLLHQFYLTEMTKEAIKTELSKVKGKIAVQINIELVETIYKKMDIGSAHGKQEKS